MAESPASAPLARWRGLLEGERAFDLIAGGDAAGAAVLGVSLAELIEHAASCGQLDALAELVARPAESASATGPRRLFDLVAAYEAGRRLLEVRAPALLAALRAVTLAPLLAELRGRPELVGCRAYDGKTLLHHAAGAHDDELVDELLRLGADPRVEDQHGRTPLVDAANLVVPPAQRGDDDGHATVARLIAAGANPDHPGGEGRQTPLHVAARRGNVGVATALLDGGAAIAPRDANGETPLRRALNCRQRQVVALLGARGADALALPSP